MKKFVVFALILLMLCGCAAAPAENTVSVEFPFGELPNPYGIPHYNAINNTAPFTASVTLPKGWKISETPGDAVMPLGEFYSLRYLFDGDKPVGYIGFDIFEPYTEEVPPEEYYKTVYPKLRLPAFSSWDPYTAVRSTENSETGTVEIHYVDPLLLMSGEGASGNETLQSNGILCYDKSLGVYVGIAFVPDAVSDEALNTIARSVTVSAK